MKFHGVADRSFLEPPLGIWWGSLFKVIIISIPSHPSTTRPIVEMGKRWGEAQRKWGERGDKWGSTGKVSDRLWPKRCPGAEGEVDVAAGVPGAEPAAGLQLGGGGRLHGALRGAQTL